MNNVTIVWGSQSGNAQNLAYVIRDELAQDLEVQIFDMSELPPEEIEKIQRLVVVTSTHGDGEAPDNASEWLSFLKFSDDLALNHLSYAVIGLGDTYYPHFCQAGKDFDHYLSIRGAHSLLPRLDCDLYYEEQYPEWLKKLKSVLKVSDSD